MLINCPSLDDAAIFSDVAKEYGETALRAVGVFDIANAAMVTIFVQRLPACVLAVGLDRPFAALGGEVDSFDVSIGVSHQVPFLQHLAQVCTGPAASSVFSANSSVLPCHTVGRGSVKNFTSRIGSGLPTKSRSIVLVLKIE
jgi:hypothetical protein